MLIVAAFVTPGPDVMSQLILFAAIYPLYEISILLVRFFERKREAELQGAGALGRRGRGRGQGQAVSDDDRARWRGSPAALERLSPPPQPAPDLAARRRPSSGMTGPDRLEPVAQVARVAIGLLVGIDRARDTLLANTRQFAARLSGQQRAALGRARHGQVEPRQGGARRGGARRRRG